MTRNSIVFFLTLVSVLIFKPPQPARAADVPEAFRSTPFPIPRFVSLRSDKIYVRTGPGARYPIKWVFRKEGLPVEIVLEFETWRKIRDVQGEEGWVHHSLLSGERTALVLGDNKVALLRKPEADSRINAYAEPGSVLKVSQCKDTWCEAEASGYKGWVERKRLWGVYANENFD